MQIIIATDSRGRGFGIFPRDHPFPGNCHVTLITTPGATISVLEKNVCDVVKLVTDSKIIVAVCAGICDLTEKVTHKEGTEVWYDINSNRVDHLITYIKQFHRHCNEQDVTIKFATIPPVSLSKSAQFNTSKHRLYNSMFSSDDIQLQQKQLERDVHYVNQEIRNLNIASNVRTVTWDKDVIKSTIRKRGRHGQNRKKVSKFVHKHLYDGIHPDSYLAEKWYRVLCNSIGNEFNDLQDVIPQVSSSDGENDIDTWDFKRRCNHQEE